MGALRVQDGTVSKEAKAGCWGLECQERVLRGGGTWHDPHACLLRLGLGFGWGRSVVPDHSPPSPETITSLYKTNFRVDVPFDLPEIFFFVALG